MGVAKTLLQSSVLGSPSQGTALYLVSTERTLHLVGSLILS